MSIKGDTSRMAHGRRSLLGWALPAVVVALTTAAAGAEADIEARLRALETKLTAVEAENQQLRRELGLGGQAGPSGVKPAGQEAVLFVNGLVQMQAEFGDKGDARFSTGRNRFFLRRARLGVSGRFAEAFDFKMEGEFANSLAGSTTPASATLTDGFINWSRFGWANVKMGQFKTPFGYEFLLADPKLATPERSLGSDRLTLNRQVGVQISGDFGQKRLGYALGWFNGNGANVSANDNANFNTVARVTAVPWVGRLFGQNAKLSVGADGYASHETALAVAPEFGVAGNSFTGNRLGTGADAQFNVGRLDLWTEYLRVRFRPTSRLPAANFLADSWAMQGGWFLRPGSLQTVVRYETFDPSSLKSGDVTNTWTFGLALFLKGDDVKLQFDYLRTELAGSSTPVQGKFQVRAQTIF